MPSLPRRLETTGRKRGEAEALPTSEGASPSVPTSVGRRPERAVVFVRAHEYYSLGGSDVFTGQGGAGA